MRLNFSVDFLKLWIRSTHETPAGGHDLPLLRNHLVRGREKLIEIGSERDKDRTGRGRGEVENRLRSEYIGLETSIGDFVQRPYLEILDHPSNKIAETFGD